VAKKTELTPEDLVLGVEPDAVVYDDGWKVYIQVKRATRMQTLGKGSSAEYAWRSAARRLRLWK